MNKISWALFVLAFIFACIAAQQDFKRTQNKIDNLTEEIQELKASVDSLENYLCD